MALARSYGRAVDGTSYQVRARWVERSQMVGQPSRVWQVSIGGTPTYTLTMLRRDATQSQIKGELATVLNCPLTSISLESVER